MGAQPLRKDGAAKPVEDLFEQGGDNNCWDSKGE